MSVLFQLSHLKKATMATENHQVGCRLTIRCAEILTLSRYVVTIKRALPLSNSRYRIIANSHITAID